MGKTSDGVVCEWSGEVARHGDIWEKTAGDSRSNRCKGTEVRTNSVCLQNGKKASVESGRR